MSRRIGVIGDKDSVLIFKAFGMDVYPATPEAREENRKLVDRLARDGYGMLLITEEVAALLGETLERYKKELAPSILLIPSGAGSSGLALRRVRENVERAVGMNILD